METVSLYLALAEKKLEDCLKLERGAEWQRLQSNEFFESLTADALANIFPKTCCVKHKQQDK